MPTAGPTLPALTAAFTAGLLLGSYTPYFPILTTAGLVILAVLPALKEHRLTCSPHAGTAWCAALLSGLLYWHIAGLIAHPSLTPRQEMSAAQPISGIVVEPVQHAPGRVTMVLELDSSTDPTQPRIGQAMRVRLVWRDPAGSYYRGDRLDFLARLRAPHGSLNPRGFDYAAYLERQGVGAVATVSGPDAVRLRASGLDLWRWWSWQWVDRCREQIRVAAVNSLAQPTLGIFLSLITGERGYLSPDVRDWFMATGTVHILSISGSHLGLVALISYGACRRLLLALPWPWLLALSRRTTPTRLAAAWTVIPVSAYAVLAGAETATMRSLLMVATALLALWLGYRRQLLPSLASAALAILLHDPQAIFDISFQLSFLSVWAIAWYVDRPASESEEADRPTSWLGTGRQWVWESLSISLVITLVTLPLVAFYFNQIPWIGVAANLVIVPMTGLLLVPMGLAAAGWLLLMGGTVLPAAAVIEPLTALIIAAVRVASTIPQVDVFVAAPTVPMIAMFYWLGSLMMAQPARSPVRRAAAAGVIVILAWWVWSPRSLTNSGAAVRATFLDVGQGDSAVVELPDGQVVLIDGGTASERFDMGRAVVAPYLWNRGIRRVDHVVASHPQLDHVGGLPWVIDRFSVGHFWSNGMVREEAFWKGLERSLEHKGLTPEIAHDGMILWSEGACQMEVLGPDVGGRHGPDRAPTPGKTLNNASIVIEISCGPRSFLFTGDLEREGLASVLTRHALRQAAILKVPHHGARSSFDPQWVSATRPAIAVFSVGAHNPYRHPAPDVLRAYAQAQAAILRTDYDGAVWIDLDVRTATVHMYRTRDWVLRPVELSVRGLHDEAANVYRLWRRWNWY